MCERRRQKVAMAGCATLETPVNPPNMLAGQNLKPIYEPAADVRLELSYAAVAHGCEVSRLAVSSWRHMYCCDRRFYPKSFR